MRAFGFLGGEFVFWYVFSDLFVCSFLFAFWDAKKKTAFFIKKIHHLFFQTPLPKSLDQWLAKITSVSIFQAKKPPSPPSWGKELIRKSHASHAVNRSTTTKTCALYAKRRKDRTSTDLPETICGISKRLACWTCERRTKKHAKPWRGR